MICSATVYGKKHFSQGNKKKSDLTGTPMQLTDEDSKQIQM